MNRKLQLFGVWCGPLAAVFFFAGIYPLAHLLPPLSPTTSPAVLSAFYSDHQISFLFGMICMLWGSALLLPLGATIAAQLQRIEGANPIMSKLLLMATPLVVVEIILPAWIFATLAFRPSWSPEITQALSDLAWLIFTWPNPVTIVMVACIGVAILSDEHHESIYPRWVGYANLAAAILYFPSCFLVLFKTGPIAWDGLLSFWTPAVDYGTWILLMTWATRRAINTQQPQPTELISA